MFGAGEKLGFDRSLTDKLASYLIDEGLLEVAAMGPMVSLTHWGLKEIEEAISAPEAPTEHFPALVVAGN